MNLKKNILNKINNKCFNIAIIGLGYVGLPLALSFSKKKLKIKIFGVDKDKTKIKYLNLNKSYISNIKNNNIEKFNSKKNIFTNNFKFVQKCDFIIICVPTPLKKNQPDLSFIRLAVKNLRKFVRNGQAIILESTSYPGTTEDLIVKKLKSRFKIGKNLFVGFSSERINPGKNEDKIETIPKVVSGYTTNCLEIISKFYKIFFKKVVKAKSIKIAEFSKLLENIYRSVNIGFVNEMKIIADKMGMDIFEIIKIANTKPYGFRRFFPGPGIGGHCIPIDPLYLSYISKKYGYESKFIKLSANINIEVLNFISKKIDYFLKSKNIKKNKLKILILGLAYKKNVDDHRESASLKLKDILNKKKIKNVHFYDPNYSNKQKIFLKIKLIKTINERVLKKYSLVILMTDHDVFDYKFILKYSNNVLDCRGRYKVSNKVIRG